MAQSNSAPTVVFVVFVVSVFTLVSVAALVFVPTWVAGYRQLLGQGIHQVSGTSAWGRGIHASLLIAEPGQQAFGVAVVFVFVQPEQGGFEPFAQELA